jgi:ABC-2 type transport system permease protein
MKDDLQHFFELLSSMTHRELTARYKHTFFGFLWVFINPLIQMIVIGFIFPFFIKDPIPHYNLYLFTGLLTWNFFSLSLSKAASSIVNERSLIKKSRFPRSVIPISIVLANAINLLLAFLLLIPPALYFQVFSLERIGYFVMGFILLIVFTIGISLLTSALNVRFRDISFFVQAGLIVWFYLTPIVYSIYSVPYNLIWVWRLNPMTSVVQFFQHFFVDFPLPGIGMISANVVISVLIFILSITIFHIESKFFDDWL